MAIVLRARETAEGVQTSNRPSPSEYGSRSNPSEYSSRAVRVETRKNKNPKNWAMHQTALACLAVLIIQNWPMGEGRGTTPRRIRVKDLDTE